MGVAIILVKGQGIVSTAIRWQSRSEFTHAALLIGGRDVIEAREFRGVRHLEIIDLLHRAEDRGESIYAADVPMTPTQAATVANFAAAQIGKRYDYWSVARFLTRRPSTRKGSGAWFCSELVFAAILEAGISLLRNIPACSVAPGHLALSTIPSPLRRVTIHDL